MKINISTGLLHQASYIPSPNHDDRQSEGDLSLIVLHNISLPPEQFGSEHINQLFTNTLCSSDHPFFAEISHLKVSSHILIRRDGEIVQYVPFHKRAWHAGVSCFQGRGTCNDFSIGIELEGTDNTPFCDIQYAVLVELLNALKTSYFIGGEPAITGHEHIAPGRKTDPGPYFDWKRLGDALGQNLPTQAVI